MSSITAAQFLKRLFLITMSCLKVPPPFFLFSSLSEPPSISIALLFLESSPLHANHLFPAFCSVRSYFPDLSQSIFLIVLSAFSCHSANYRCQGRVCAHVPMQMMNSCKSFNRWQTQINMDTLLMLKSIARHQQKPSQVSPLTHVIRPRFKQPAAALLTRS